MKTSEVLHRVRLHLRDGEEHQMAHQRYICYALDYLYYTAGVIGDRDRYQTKKLIEAQLGNYYTLEHWLQESYGIRIKGTKTYRKKIMATRKAWLTHLIEHYSHKGD
jgi:hypothetical protein